MPTATHKLYNVAGGVPTLVPGQPSVVTAVAGALHHACLLDDAGNVYCWGDNAYGEVGNGNIGGGVGSAVKISTDSLGNPFNNIVQVCPGASGAGYHTVALKADGTVWIWGATGTAIRGNGTVGGTTTRPVQINFPAGITIKQIKSDLICAALDQNGQVWTWGGMIGYAMPYILGQGKGNPDPTVPTKINIPGTVVDLQAGSQFNYAFCSNGDIYGWGFYPNLMGMGASAPAQLAPVKLNSYLNLPGPVKQLICNNESTFALLTDGTIWAWGDNACGSVGNGQELNWATYKNSGGQAAPYAWDWGQAELLVAKPVQIAVGKNDFTVLSTGLGDVFYTYAEDASGNLYSWGRNKGGVLGNGQMNATGDILSIYPNSFDVAWVTAINPFALTKAALTSSPYCVLNPGGSPCNEYNIPAVANPTCTAGTNQNITTSTTTLTGSATTANTNTFVNYYLWTQVSGPSTSLITLPSGPKANVSNLVSGTYVFQLNVTDNNWRTASSQVTVVVNSTGGTNKPPVARPNGNITITLPTNSTALDGTASSDPDGTIASYAWQQSSGPNSATIATPTASKTNLTGLVAGTYIFNLTVTDNQGATNTAPVTVTVNPAAAQTPPTVSAGTNQTITLPISTATLTGTATGTNGATISSTSWSQVSGPSTATIISIGNVVTVVNALVQGTYTFRLSATDNNGQSASSTVTVTVNATAPAPPPTVDAGVDKTITLPTNSVTLTGTATGNGGATISSTSWTQTAGPSTATIGAAGSLSTSFSNLVQGAYTFTLQATDSKGQTSSDNVVVTVNSAPAVPPTVSAGSAQTVTLPTNSATVTGTATGNGGATIVSTTWAQSAGPNTATINTAGALSTVVSNLVAGSYSFVLAATDSKGQTGTSVVNVTVNPAPAVPPTVSAGSNQTITLPTSTATLTGTATGNGGATISTTSWTETSGPSTATIGTPAALSSTVSNLVAGTYTFLLSATDNKGQTATSTVTVTVNPAPAVPPTVSAGSNQTITLPTSTATLTGTATGNGGATISSTSWTETSGPSTATIGTPAALSTAVSSLVAGTYTFLLTATDNKGQTATSSVTVTVNSAGPPPTFTPPTVTAGSAQTITLPTSTVTLTGTATGNGGATISSKQWSQIGGPTTATIGSASSLSTSVSNLAQGVYIFLLSATDNNGQTGSAYVTITVNPAPAVPPTVNAGTNQTITLPTNTVILTGTATGNGGATISSTQWSQISGPSAATIGTPGSLNSTISNLVQGAYVFLLSAKDNNNQTGSAYITVTVNPASHTPPTVSAGTNLTIKLPTNSTNLGGTATGNDGATIVSTQWTQVGGSSVATIGGASTLTPTVSNLVQGNYVFALTANDSYNATASSYVTVTVNPATVAPPTVNAGTAQIITLPVNSTTLTGTATASGGATITSTQWSQIGGPSTATIGSAGSLGTTVSNLVQGIYVFLLNATDNNGQSASAYVTVTVNPAASPLIPPTVTATAQNLSLTPPTYVTTLIGTATGNNGATITSVQWTQVSGPAVGTFGTANAVSSSLSGLFNAGDYVFQLKATDNHGQIASASVTITVNAVPPPPTVSAGNDQTITLPANTATLTGAATANGGLILNSTLWELVSGPTTAVIGSPNNLTTAISNLAFGDYVFRLTAADNMNQKISDVVTVHVVQPATNIPPIANPGSNQTFTLTGKDTSISLNGSASFDPDGYIVSYSWYQLSGKGGVTIANSNTATPTLTGLQTGVYVFVLAVTDNRGATAQAQLTITVNSVLGSGPSTPASNLVANAGKDTIIALPASSVQLNGSGSSDAGGTIASYEWKQVAGPEGVLFASPDAALTQANNLQAGSYQFRLIVTSQTGDTASAIVKVTVMSDTRTHQDTTDEKFFLYPNPAHDQTTLNMTGGGEGTVMLNLFDLNGKFVKALQFSKIPGTSSVTIDVSRLTAGMYIIRATYGNGRMQQIKLMKQ